MSKEMKAILPVIKYLFFNIKTKIKCNFIKLFIAIILYYIARIHKRSKNFTLSSKYYHKAADWGCAQAQHSLGVMYYYGNNVKQDFSQALNWYCKASIQGNTKAQHTLGIMYGKGQGVKSNYKMAFYWYKKAESSLKNINYN